MTAPLEITGGQLITSWLDRNHPRLRTCGGCNKDVTTTGITKLVYSHEVCSCDRYDYDHLVEQLWHRECFAAHEVEALDQDGAAIVADAAIEYLRSLLANSPAAAVWFSLPELIERAKTKARNSHEPRRSERIEKVDRCIHVLRAAGRVDQ